MEINDSSDKNNVENNYYLGVYYQFIKPDYGLMKKYYLFAISNKNIEAIIVIVVRVIAINPLDATS